MFVSVASGGLVLYARTVLFWVYSLRNLGRRRSGNVVAREGLLGELVMAPHAVGWHGRPLQLVRLLKPGTTEEMLPSLLEARVIGIRRSLLIAGTEQVTSKRPAKSC